MVRVIIDILVLLIMGIGICASLILGVTGHDTFYMVEATFLAVLFDMRCRTIERRWGSELN